MKDLEDDLRDEKTKANQIKSQKQTAQMDEEYNGDDPKKLAQATAELGEAEEAVRIAEDKFNRVCKIREEENANHIEATELRKQFNDRYPELKLPSPSHASTSGPHERDEGKFKLSRKTTLFGKDPNKKI